MSSSKFSKVYCSLMLFLMGGTWLWALDPSFIRTHYTKYEYRIPMRDGVHLFTIVYVPKDKTTNYPILLTRTPYRIAPYGPDQYLENPGNLRARYFQEGYIVAYQDVRGRYMSEGEFVQVRPYITDKTQRDQIDETTDTYDTVEWLVSNVPANNGRVGISGISYPGFYASMGTIDAHPAVKATSPQAPVSKWMAGDDWYHNGAFLLAHAFSWMVRHGRSRPGPSQESAPSFDYGTPDGYQFFLDLGPLPNVAELYMADEVPFWRELMTHGTWDEFWEARDVLPHLRGITPAVMVVGGWFDAENLYGALETYASIEKHNPQTENMLVMGPWYHGQWNRDGGQMLGPIDFGSRTSDYYIEHVELPFFNYHLKNLGRLDLPEALMFDTGAGKWESFDAWPPEAIQKKVLFLRDDGQLTFDRPKEGEEPFQQYISDPAKPVPYTAEMNQWYDKSYMLEDQRFASRRPDVLVFQTPTLDKEITIGGPIEVSFHVSTTGTDSDWVVKIIDVFPGNTPDPIPNPTGIKLGGYQMLVRGDVLRGKFRESLSSPKPFEPGKITPISFVLQDVLHTFKKGHRIMVQVQSSWFPLIDMNPQQFQDIYKAKTEDFQKATQRVYLSAQHASRLEIEVLEKH